MRLTVPQGQHIKCDKRVTCISKTSQPWDTALAVIEGGTKAILVAGFGPVTGLVYRKQVTERSVTSGLSPGQRPSHSKGKRLLASVVRVPLSGQGSGLGFRVLRVKGFRV